VIARVLLGETLVGHLRSIGARVALTFDPAFCERADRPVLSWHYEEAGVRPHDESLGASDEHPLPAFFRNALPEGALRKVLEARFRGTSMPEYEMLLRLGGDLPGNLRVVSDQLLSFDDEDGGAAAKDAIAGQDQLRFSLAGIQLKASVLASADRVTLPLVGAGGDWIAKFPSGLYRDLPENEHATLGWAALCGLSVPEHRLVPVRSIENLPPDFPPDGNALLVKRFDRLGGGHRVHQEDFAQVFGVQPEDRYLQDVPEYAHYAGIGAVVANLCGAGDFLEYARRLAFMLLCGNGDAHVKNWALIYPDGMRPRLSPLYDFVATVAYPTLGTALALGFVEPDDPNHLPGVPMTSIGYEHFSDMAERAGSKPHQLEAAVREFATKARDGWQTLRPEFPKFARSVLEGHMNAIRL
jgi:serine/threonine-protein kinase HipA